jgi:hypothetical protein
MVQGIITADLIGGFMDSINLQEIIRYLSPTPQTMVWDVFLYVIFFFALLSLLLMPDKNLVPTLMIATVLLCALIAKLSLGSRREAIVERGEFGMFVVNAVMFAFPLIAAALIRARKSRATAPAVITSLIAGVYFFLFWFIIQRPLT